MAQTGAILVTGATGAQGGATIDALLRTGIAVRALVRDPLSERARDLANRGVELAQGEFDDQSSLATAMRGVGGVFSVQMPSPPADPQSEVRTGRNLIEAALAAGARTFVHTSVARAGDHENFVGWNEGRWTSSYWEGKAAVNAMVRSAGFSHWVVLKPAFMMDNYIPPKADWMFPMLSDGILNTVMIKGAKLHLIAASDVGRFAAAAFAEEGRFHGYEIDMAAEALDADETAAISSRVTGRTITARHMTAEAALASGLHSGLVSSQEWANVEGYKIDLPRANSYGIALEGFEPWSQQHSSDFALAGS